MEAYRGATASGGGGGSGGDRVNLVGALRLDPSNLEAHGDVAGYKKLAFVGKWRGVPGHRRGHHRHLEAARAGEDRGHAGLRSTSMEDMQAIRIGRRDILAIGLQDCGNSATAGTVGLELYDITNPRNPQFLTIFNARTLPPDGQPR